MLILKVKLLYNAKIVSEYDQKIPQSQTTDNPVAPRGRAAQPLLTYLLTFIKAWDSNPKLSIQCMMAFTSICNIQSQCWHAMSAWDSVPSFVSGMRCNVNFIIIQGTIWY